MLLRDNKYMAMTYSPVPNYMGGGALKKSGGSTDNLNINKRGGPNKRGVWRGEYEDCSWSTVATRSD